MTTRLSDFEGIWQMDRTIRHDDGTLAQAEGRAHLSPDGAGLTYHEAGQLRIAGMAPLTFERDYLWRQGAGRIDMMFADGRFFHAFGTDAPEALHDCPPDTYRVSYGFDLPRGWSSRWRVDGRARAM